MLPDAFFERPIAHRALHDRKAGRTENSLASVHEAVKAGYGIEIDVQCSADGVAMVFHDYELSRLTDEGGAVAQRSAKDLGQVRLLDDPGTIPTLAEVLKAVDGKVPLLIEIKDQDGAMQANVGPLGAAVIADLEGYTGDVALMSFNPHHVKEVCQLKRDIPRGLVTDPYQAKDWPTLPAHVCERLAQIPDYDAVGASFISHKVSDLMSGRVRALRKQGAQVLCWTVRSAEQEAEARRIADNITFEGYLA